MNTKEFLGMLLMAFFAVVSLTSCSNDDEEGRKVTDYKEYTITVASKKLSGVVSSCGNNVFGDVYAVKKENSTEWEALYGIEKFEYEEGYEYKIRISETSCLDYSMGEPAWTEYELLEVLSKERKDSENLPLHFVPNWYFEHYGYYIDPNFAYAIDADKKEEIENDLKADASYKFNGMRYHIEFPKGKWFLLDKDMNTIEQGILIVKHKEPTELPETYKLLPPEQQIAGHGHFDFVTNTAPDSPVLQFDAFIVRQSHSGKYAGPTADYYLLFYKDLTAYYQSKYPDANVKAVVIRYEVKK